jgi:hypothetical protein
MAKPHTPKPISPEAEAVLAQYAAEIRTLEEHNDDARSQAKRNALKIGERLREAKDLVGHGKFMKWVKREFTWAHKTADNYMRLVKVFGHNSDIMEIVTNSAIDLSALYKLMVPEVPPEVRDSALELAEQYTADDWGLVVDQEAARYLIIQHQRKARAARRAAERAAANNRPPEPILPEDILARIEAFRIGVEELCRQCRHAAGVALPRSYDPVFALSVRVVLLDLVKAEFGDDAANRALLKTAAAELDQQGSPAGIVTEVEHKKRAARLQNLLWPEKEEMPF